MSDAEKPQPVTPVALPMAPPALQKKFDELEVWRYGDGSELEGLLLEDVKQAKAEKDADITPEKRTAGYLDFTFVDTSGKYSKGTRNAKTNFLAALTTTNKNIPLAVKIVKNENNKFNTPDIMINGYAPDPKSPELLHPMKLAAEANDSRLIIALLEKNPGIETTKNLTADGGTLFHAMMVDCTPDTIDKVLQYFAEHKNTFPEAILKDLFKQKTGEKALAAMMGLPGDLKDVRTLFTQKPEGKTPLQMLELPPNLRPFLDHHYLTTKAEMEEEGGKWLDKKKEKFQWLRVPDKDWDAVTLDVLSMHETLRKDGIKRNITPLLGEQIIALGRDEPQSREYCLQKLAALCEYADDTTKNAWLAETVAYQPHSDFVPELALLLMNKGAKPANIKVLTNMIWHENPGVFSRGLESCKNDPQCLDNPNPQLDEPVCPGPGYVGSSALRYTLLCLLKNDAERWSMVEDLLKAGSLRNEDTYDKPLTQTIVTTTPDFQIRIIGECGKHELPYPAGIKDALKKSWRKENPKLPPSTNMKDILDKQALIEFLLGQWENDEKQRKARPPKRESGAIPAITPDYAFDGHGVDKNANPLPMTLTTALRRMG